MTPFGMVEKAVKQVIEAGKPDLAGKVGGDLAYTGEDQYVYIGLIPGGSADEVDGEWYVDIDVFGRSYSAAMRTALDLETVLLKRRHVTEEMRLDRTYQNEGPSERPWDDEAVYRIGATYVFTARRSG